MAVTSHSSRRLSILIIALAGTFLVVRGSMLFRPDADLFVAGFNIHHVFTGILIATVCAIPLVVGAPKPFAGDLLVGGLGVGLSLALDEVVYLIVTDGSNKAYLTRASWVGGATLITVACVYAAVVSRVNRNRDPR